MCCVVSAGQSGVSIKLAAGETAFEIWCLVYIHCYQEGGSKAGIYNVVAWMITLREFTEVQKKFSAGNSDVTHWFFCGIRLD